VPCGLPDEERLTEDIIALTKEFGRYGYCMITGMLNNRGWHVNHKRVEQILRREGLNGEVFPIISLTASALAATVLFWL
jgi:hypothetical protein